MSELKEEIYVHQVYNDIAPHFSQTRYKPWPIVTKFLNELPTGSIGIDVGCGNGKYLNTNPDIYIIGSDRSSKLIECAHSVNKSYNILIADGMHLPHKENTFDFAISIAVIHHWSTRERRISAIRHIVSKLKSSGRALIYCWALEQKNSRRGYHEGLDQDVLVPWVLQDIKSNGNLNDEFIDNDNEKPDLSGILPQERSVYMEAWKRRQKQKREEMHQRDKKEKNSQKTTITKYRYYHLYREGELEEDCKRAGCIIESSGYEKDNWYVIVKKV